MTACSNWDMKLEIKVETVGSSPKLGPLKIAIIRVITLYDYRLYTTITEKFLQFDWPRAVVFQLNLKYLHLKITHLLQVVV